MSREFFQNWELGNRIAWRLTGEEEGDVPLLDDMVDNFWTPYDKPFIVKYLRDAPVHAALLSSDLRLCYLCQFVKYDPSVVRSDGVWRWPDYLAHLVDAHSVRIPDAFVDHIRHKIKN